MVKNRIYLDEDNRVALKKTSALKPITEGLVLSLDANDASSYPGSGNTWYDISGCGMDWTIESGITWSSNGYFETDSVFLNRGFYSELPICTGTSSTVVFWIKTSDTKSVFLSTSYDPPTYLGAYGPGNAGYDNNVGTVTYYVDTIETTNIRDNVADGEWHMVECKNVDLSSFMNVYFNKYSSIFYFENTQIANIMIYNRNLTAGESLYNFGRFVSLHQENNVHFMYPTPSVTPPVTPTATPNVTPTPSPRTFRIYLTKTEVKTDYSSTCSVNYTPIWRVNGVINYVEYFDAIPGQSYTVELTHDFNYPNGGGPTIISKLYCIDSGGSEVSWTPCNVDNAITDGEAQQLVLNIPSNYGDYTGNGVIDEVNNRWSSDCESNMSC